MFDFKQRRNPLAPHIGFSPRDSRKNSVPAPTIQKFLLSYECTFRTVGNLLDSPHPPQFLSITCFLADPFPFLQPLFLKETKTPPQVLFVLFHRDFPVSSGFERAPPSGNLV